jgi:hypothetical protein
MATKTIGEKMMSRMKTTDYPVIWQERNRSLSFTLLTGSSIMKPVSVPVPWKYAGLLLFLML